MSAQRRLERLFEDMTSLEAAAPGPDAKALRFDVADHLLWLYEHIRSGGACPDVAAAYEKALCAPGDEPEGAP